MKFPLKNLFIVFALFLFTFLFFKYREGLNRSEWITPGYHNKDRYYNEHKTSGNPEIDAIEFNHRSKKPVYIDSSIHTTIVDIEPIKRVSKWRSKVKKLNDARSKVKKLNDARSKVKKLNDARSKKPIGFKRISSNYN